MAIPCVRNFLLLAYFIASSVCFPPQLPKQACPADKKEPWTYRGENGPMYWGIKYRDCYGWRQSPVKIETSNVEMDEKLPKLIFRNYNIPVSKAIIENNGHTIEIQPEDGVKRSISVKGSTYELRQFHFHWGSRYDRGSEHYLNGEQYAMEIHFVHFNDNREIAVVGALMQESGVSNAALRNITNELSKVMYKDTETELTSILNLASLLPDMPASYYRYYGSLTTPDCAEGVTWSVMTVVQTVGTNEMNEFRKLYSAKKEEADKGCKLVNNYRPIQPLYGRKIYRSQ